MANILLTQQCIRSCPYCFAKQHMSENAPDDTLTWENLMYIVDFFDASNEKHFSLLGGEPFLHPNFIDIVLYLRERKFRTNVFTSGVMSNKMFEEAIKEFAPITPNQLSFVVNVNDPKKTSFSELETVKRFLRAFGHFSSLSFNVYREDFDMDFLVQYINEYGLKRHIRLGLAHPIPGVKNSHIKPDGMRDMAKNLMSFIPKLNANKISVGFDCGMPMCLFTDEEMGILYKHAGGQLKFTCGPAVDVGPDMSVWTCFPLSNYKKTTLFDFDNVQQIRRYYSKMMNAGKSEIHGIFEACDDCEWRTEKLCSGGCYAHSVSKFHNEPENLRKLEEVINNE